VSWASAGWIGMGWPKQYGGGERPPLDRLIVAEELITAGAPLVRAGSRIARWARR
jgi:alkylation response protein AidB-like acyl-CoA dehydrogenase